MDDWEKSEESWSVLKRARPVKVSPYFSRRVMAAIRSTPAQPMVPTAVLRWLGGAALAAVVFGFVLSMESEMPTAMATDSPEFVEVFDAAAGLDKLATTDDFSVTHFASGL